jgi:hypothetical protein
VKRLAIAVMLMTVALGLVGCDKPTVNPIERGQSAVDQARSVAATDFDQKIDMAINLIKANRLSDAQNLLNEVTAHESSLSESAKTKLADAKEQLAQAKQ